MATAKQARAEPRPVVPPVQAAPAEAAPAAPTAPAVQGNATDLVQELKVSGHLMSLPAGLFCIVNEGRPGAASGAVGGMPGIRISLPPVNGEDIEIVGFRSDGWLNAEGDAALVRTRRASQVLVTVYQLPNQQDAAPKLQVRQLAGTGIANPADAAPAEAAPAAVAAPEAQPAAQRMDIVAHIQSRGDVAARFGSWLGERGSGNWVEGFAVAAPDGIEAADVSYQAVLGRGWLSPWVDAGQYCGSRGMALPLLGFRMKLSGEAAERYDLAAEATFVGGSTAGPVGNDETCEAEALAPLESLLITLTPKTKAKPRRKG